MGILLEKNCVRQKYCVALELFETNVLCAVMELCVANV